MAKAKAAGVAYKCTVTGVGPTRVDGNILSVSTAGVTIETRAKGRRTMVNRFIPTGQVIACTGEGPGYVIANTEYMVGSFAGTLVEETEDTVTIADADQTEITFYTSGPNAVHVEMVEIADDDRSLNRGTVESSIKRRAEGGARKPRGEKKSGKAAPAGKRRRRRE